MKILSILGISYVRNKGAQCFCWTTRQVGISFHVVLALSFLQGFGHPRNRFQYCRYRRTVVCIFLLPFLSDDPSSSLVRPLLPCINVLCRCVYRSGYCNFPPIQPFCRSLSSLISVCSHRRVGFHILAGFLATGVDRMIPHYPDHPNTFYSSPQNNAHLRLKKKKLNSLEHKQNK